MRTITITGDEKGIHVDAREYIGYVHVIFDLQSAIELLKQEMLKNSTSNIVIPSAVRDALRSQ